MVSVLVHILALGAITTGHIFNHSEVFSNNGGVSAYESGDLDSALQRFSKSATKAPSNAAIQYNLGTTFHHTKALDKAQKQYQQAIQLGDREVQQKSFYNLGNSTFEQAQKIKESQSDMAKQLLTTSAQAYIEALKLDPDDSDARYNLEQTLLALEKLEPTENKEGDKDEENKDPNSKEDSDKKESKAKKDKEKQSKSEKKKEKPAQPMSKDEIKRILKAVEESERLQRDEKRRKVQGRGEW